MRHTRTGEFVTAVGTTSQGHRVRVYSTGKGWNAYEGRMATAAEVAEVESSETTTFFNQG